MPFRSAVWFLLVPIASSLSGHGRAAPAGQTVQPVATRQRERRSIVGVWRVVKFCDDDSVGSLYEPYGPHPGGYFIYTATGQLSIQITRTPTIQPFAAGDDQPTGAESRALLDSYMGYFGRYTVTSDSTVIHHVEGGTLPSYIGTDQARVYQIRGDTLTIGSSRRTWPCRVLLWASP
jgi:hypothetical protein